MYWDRHLYNQGGNLTQDTEYDGVVSNLYHPGNEVMVSAPISSKLNN